MGKATLKLDALIFGGGAAGLWLLDELHRRSFRAALIEKNALGAGQTITSQGILHGGLKYALAGLLSGSAKAVGEMTDLWRQCLDGLTQPDLRGVRILSPSCYLWRTESLASVVGLVGARLGLRTPVAKVAPAERPKPLAACPGEVLRVDEQVIDVGSLLAELAGRHAARILKIGDANDITLTVSKPGHVDAVELRRTDTNDVVRLEPGVVIFTAGEGNEELRRRVGLATAAMQLRPLHMVMVRGSLPQLFGHCVDGNKTRVTITTAIDSRGRTVWHIGGKLAEKGVDLSPTELIRFARHELPSVLPAVDLKNTEWAVYRINRAEGRDPRGQRPEGPVWRREGSVITAWPTKLVLAPRLAELIADALVCPSPGGDHETPLPPDWPRPQVAQPPWEVIDEWHA
ncbi:MAG: FAD-dependent oxidoreductase [Planctomycetota bacterium]